MTKNSKCYKGKNNPKSQERKSGKQVWCEVSKQISLRATRRLMARGESLKLRSTKSCLAELKKS